MDTTHVNETRTFVLFVIGTIIFGLLNAAFHFWSDYHLSLFIGQMNGVDLMDSSNWDSDIILFNSLYSGPRLGSITLTQAVFIVLIAGYVTTVMLMGLFRHKRMATATLVAFLIVWLVKIPVTIEYSNFKGIWLGLLAW